MLHPLQSALVEGTAWLDPFVQDFRARFMTLLAGAFRHFTPGLALSLIHPQLTFSEAETQKSVSQPASVRKADGSLLTAYDLKRLQVGLALPVSCLPGLDLLRSRQKSVSQPAIVRKADGSLLTAYELKRLLGLTLLRSRQESVS